MSLKKSIVIGILILGCGITIGANLNPGDKPYTLTHLQALALNYQAYYCQYDAARDGFAIHIYPHAPDTLQIYVTYFPEFEKHARFKLETIQAILDKVLPDWVIVKAIYQPINEQF